MQETTNLPKLTVAEFEIMKVFWNQGACSIATILKGVNRGRLNGLSRSTIRVQVNRLIEKNWVCLSEEGKATQYSATVPRIKASLSIADDIKERIFNGSCLELIKALFRSSEISTEEMNEIRSLIDQQKNKEEEVNQRREEKTKERELS